MVDMVEPKLRVHGLVHGLLHGLWLMVHGDLQNLLGEHGGLPCVLPSTVHLDLGNHHDAHHNYTILRSVVLEASI